MKLLFVADGRSPTAQSWINNVIQDGHRVSLISTYPCQQFTGLEEFHILPVAFSGTAAGGLSPALKNRDTTSRKSLVKRLRPALMHLRYYLGPLTLPFYQQRFERILERIAPELIHALRIPFEGMLSSRAPGKYPLVLSIWGNDLTLHANGSLFMSHLTQKCLFRADGLLADASRDIRLARSFGLNVQNPTMVIPGCGGIDLIGIEKARTMTPKGLLGSIPQNKRLVINPRGLRPGSLRTDVFFQAIRLLSGQYTDLLFVCPNMARQPEAEKYTSDPQINQSVLLLPRLSQPELWWLYTRSELLISPGAHDGVPNSFLESLAAGCFPIVGDIESMREWITPGINGLVYPVDDPQSLSEAVTSALDNPQRRQAAARINRKIIREKADRVQLRPQISAFYQHILG